MPISKELNFWETIFCVPENQPLHKLEKSTGAGFVVFCFLKPAPMYAEIQKGFQQWPQATAQLESIKVSTRAAQTKLLYHNPLSSYVQPYVQEERT